MTKRSPVLCLFVISGFCFFTGVSSRFHIIEVQKNYENAKSYCKEMFTDLATVRNLADMNNLVAEAASTTVVRAWIGLETGAVWKWQWTLPEHQLVFTNWRAGEPQIKNQDACAAMDQRGKWFESDCGNKNSFVCHGSESTGHIFVANLLSWRDAQNHCRGLSSDLVSIISAEVNTAVLNVSLPQNVWIGLFKDPWKWSDGSSSSFRDWKPSQPNYNRDQNCVAAVFRDGGKWNDLKCQRSFNFVCHGDSKLTSTTTQTTTQTTTTTPQPSTTTTEATTTTSQTTTQTTTTTPLPTTTTTAATTTTTQTTTQTTTTTPLPTTTTTEVTSTTTQTTTQTTTTVQIPTSTTTIETTVLTTPTVQPNTTTLTTSTTPMGTSANTTQLSNPTSTQSSPAGNLILIQQLMTWIEAMGYCREHHIDLVHITTEDIQQKVAEKARNATSRFVWLGMRYTCNFGFWFWTRSTSGCYQNWAPGEGTDGRYGCGVTGAIQATGGQQWVGLPETSKLNFICSTCPD